MVLRQEVMSGLERRVDWMRAMSEGWGEAMQSWIVVLVIVVWEGGGEVGGAWWLGWGLGWRGVPGWYVVSSLLDFLLFWRCFYLEGI